MNRNNKDNVIANVRLAQNIIESLARETLDWMTRAKHGGHFNDEQQLAEVYTHLEKSKSLLVRAEKRMVNI